MWYQSGFSLVSVWFQSGFSVVSVWVQFGDVTQPNGDVCLALILIIMLRVHAMMHVTILLFWLYINQFLLLGTVVHWTQ